GRLGVWKTLGKSSGISQGQFNRAVQEGRLCSRCNLPFYRNGRRGWRKLQINRMEGSRSQDFVDGVLGLYQQQQHGMRMQTLRLRSRGRNTGIFQVGE